MKRRKTIEIAVLMGLVLSILLSFTTFEAECEDIRSNLFRLHILANSDSDADQALKLLVRDRLLNEGFEIFANASSEEDAINMAKENLPRLKQVAEDEIAKNGYDYPVTVEIGKSEFNTRIYDDFTLPAGEYMALRVLIGEAKGKNWWCVMFPPVCLPAAMDSDLSDVLDDDSLDVTNNPNQYKIRFKSVEIYEEIRSKLKSIF